MQLENAIASGIAPDLRYMFGGKIRVLEQPTLLSFVFLRRFPLLPIRFSLGLFLGFFLFLLVFVERLLFFLR